MAQPAAALGVPTVIAPAPGPAEPPAAADDAPWLDAPPHLKEMLEEAVRRLSSSEGTFSEATALENDAERACRPALDPSASGG